MIPYYEKKSKWKLYLGAAGALVLAFSLFYTNYLAQKLTEGEKNKMLLWAKAYESISKNTADSETDMTVQLEIVGSNKDIPTILVQQDENKEIIVEGANFGKDKDTSIVYLQDELHDIKRSKIAPIVIQTEFYTQLLYYKHSKILRLLTYFPIIQFFLILAFVLLGYIGFSGVRKAEQNQVWVGMAKETAHQLGTPISAIVAWIELLKMQNMDKDQHEIIGELNNDVMRLELIADRFSKIGSAPELSKVNIHQQLVQAVEYMRIRASKNIQFEVVDNNEQDIYVKLNGHLFDWVIENIIRNALDAMGNKGQIVVQILLKEQDVHIDITDTGKGILPQNQKLIFSPGFTTKKRGWGLGLSLAKRIIENYHKGKIFVKKSQLNIGTTISIILPVYK